MVEKDIAGKMIVVSQSLATMLELTYHGFRTLNRESIKEAEKGRDEVRKQTSKLAGFLISRCSSSEKEKEKECIRRFLPLSSTFDRMSYNLDGIIDRLKEMIRQDILFSDRGNREISGIFDATIQILRSLPDLILTQNELVAEHNEERAKAIFRTANECAEEHEKRLIEGVCIPKASPIFLGFIESLKAIASHALEVGKKIVSLPSHSW